MHAQSKPASGPTPAVPDLRRAISRQTWLANRARNALRRPVFIGAISVGTFVTALVSMVVVPRTEQAPVIPPRVRPDTLSVAATQAITRVQLAQAESALAVSRADAASAAAARAVPDTLTGLNAVRRDSLDMRIGTLSGLMTRVEQAPLPSSYKALAELPELRADARVRALVDSLSDIERQREGFGAVGGVDPVFVALTSRANEIGRAIRSVAEERRTAMRAMLAAMEPSAREVAATAPAADTVARVTQRDSIRSVLENASAELTRLRASTRAMDLEEDRARERASATAPPLALLASAFVLSAVIGFGFALVGELRRPRVADANELERFLGIRVLSTVETPMPSAERGRRQADRAAPPYFDPEAEGYQLAYLGFATEHPTVLMATITGDDPAIAAVVACNLSATAAHEARNTLVVDLEASCSASAALRVRAEPGIADILEQKATWPEATIAARVGRDTTVDLVPYGVTGIPVSADQVVALLRQDASRLARYYDAVFFLANIDVVAAGLPAALPLPEVAVCAQPGITPLRQLRDQMEKIRTAGGSIRGIILWDAARPLLPMPRELASRPKRKKNPESRVAVATPAEVPAIERSNTFGT